MPQGLQQSICWAQDVPLMNVCGSQGCPFAEREEVRGAPVQLEAQVATPCATLRSEAPMWPDLCAALLQGDMTEALRSMDAGMAAAEAELKLASTALPVMGPPGPGLARVLSVTQRQAAAAAQELDAHSCGAAQACDGSGAAQTRAQQQPAAVDSSDGKSAGDSSSAAAAEPPVQQQPAAAAARGSSGAGGGGGSSTAAAQAPVQPQQQQQAAAGAPLPEDAPTQIQQQAGPGVQLDLTPEARWGATEGHFAEMLQDFLVRSAGIWQKAQHMHAQAMQPQACCCWGNAFCLGCCPMWAAASLRTPVCGAVPFLHYRLVKLHNAATSSLLLLERCTSVAPPQATAQPACTSASGSNSCAVGRRGPVGGGGGT